MHPQRLVPMAAVLATLILAGSCSLQDYAVDMISDALTGDEGSAVFLEENDPQLVGDALPFAIKLYESLLAQNPGHEGLILTTGSLYVMYANAFLQTPALYLSWDEYDLKVEYQNRAKNLYLRGRDYMTAYLEERYPGFIDAVNGKGDLDGYLAMLAAEDLPYAYWMVAGWFGAISIDSFDMQLSFRIPALVAVLERCNEIDPEFNLGAVDELFIQIYASIPESMGGSVEAAEAAFERTIARQEGRSASPFVSLAVSVAMPAQDLERFISLMERALEIDAEEFPELRLMNTISQRKARWYLDHIEDYFIY
jgi:predicted anti-sigma-YlaC factor YlaD